MKKASNQMVNTSKNTMNKVVAVATEIKNSPVKLLMAGAGLLAIVFAGKEAVKLFKKSKEQQATDDIDAAIKDEQNNGNKLSYPIAYYNTYADQIEQATDAAGTDTDSIYEVMAQMNNNADVLQLIKAYGKRMNLLMFVPLGYFSLPQILISELSGSELQHVNTILSQKGINIQF